jgi:hypothetical protein
MNTTEKYVPQLTNVKRVAKIRQHFALLEEQEFAFADYLREEFGQFVAADHIQRLKFYASAKDEMLRLITEEEVASAVNNFDHAYTSDTRSHVEKVLLGAEVAPTLDW